MNVPELSIDAFNSDEFDFSGNESLLKLWFTIRDRVHN